MQLYLQHFSLRLIIFIVLAFLPIGSKNIELTKSIAKIWEHSNMILGTRYHIQILKSPNNSLTHDVTAFAAASNLRN